MNANEVLANRAAEILGERLGTYTRVHPNDHVNMGQSTNDVYPTATRLAILFVLARSARRRRARSADALAKKSREFSTILKTGRTHLQDAVPITLGQEFGGYAANVAHAADELERTAAQLYELNLGATAVGTGLNAGDDYTREAIAQPRALHGTAASWRRPTGSGSRRAWETCSPTRERCAGSSVEVAKIASDLRLLSMGPRAGIAEIQLPAVQPGSSIMPGKVNPSVPEMVNQVCCQVIGCDAAILAAADAGQLELNVMMPVIAWNALHATTHPRPGDARPRRARASAASPLTPAAPASCSIAARPSRPRSARISATLRQRRSRSCRSRPAARSARSSANAV